MEDAPPSLWSLIKADYERLGALFAAPMSHVYPNFYAVLSHRISHALYERGWRKLAGVLMVLCHTLTGAEIRPGARIGPGLVLVHTTGVNVGEVLVGRNLSLFGNNTLGYNWDGRQDEKSGSPIIGDDVAVFGHASVFGRVRVGDRVANAAYALVLDAMPDDTWPRGIPAKPAPRPAHAEALLADGARGQ